MIQYLKLLQLITCVDLNHKAYSLIFKVHKQRVDVAIEKLLSPAYVRFWTI